MPTHSRATQSGAMENLVAQIDSYLAEQLTIPRPNSAGTMFVDFDQHGEIQVSYRKRRETSHCSPLLVTRDAHARYDRHAAGLYVSGYDPSTQFQYDYDGTVMHIHRDSSRPSSAYSDYYSLDAERYSPFRLLVSQDDGNIPSLHSKERRKLRRAMEFIQTVLRKIEGLGLMRRFREDRVKAKQMASQRNRNMKNCFVESPVPQIPVNWMERVCT
jgi:hypothetical protein